jgi:hypothetical protein
MTKTLKNIGFGMLMGILAGLLAIFFASCGTVKKSVERSAVSVHDTVAVHDTVSVVRHDSVVHERVEYDTVVTVAASSVSASFTPALKGGVVKHAGNLTVSAHSNKDGSIDVECDADSLNLVIKNLVWENEYRGYQVDSMHNVVQMSRIDSTAVSSSVVVKTRGGGFFSGILNSLRYFLDLLGIVYLFVLLLKLKKRI